jgi:putative membrane protein
MKNSKRYWLEKERTLLANERTFLAYLRTAFATLIFGFALIQLANTNDSLKTIGLASLITGLGLVIIGIIHFFTSKKNINGTR